MFGRKGQRAEFCQRDAHADGLLLHKRACTGGADLVHLEVHDFTVPDTDVLAVLSADLKHSIDLRYPVSCTLGLRSDLIPDSIRADALADTLTSGAGHADSRKSDITKPLTNTCKSFADSSFRVTCGAQILKVYQFTVSTDQNKVGTGRTDVDAQCAATFWNDLGSVWLRKARAGAQFQFGQCSDRVVCCSCTVQRIIQLT